MDRYGRHRLLPDGGEPRSPATHPGGLEQLQGRMPRPDVAPTGCAPRDRGGVRGVDDVLGLGDVGHPQRHPKVGVGPDLRTDDAAGSLRCEHEVDAERPAALRDTHQAPDEIG